MQLANIWLSLGEDAANTVPKKGVTPAEVALLTAIHGENAVQDIDILDDNHKGSARGLLQELAFKYGNARDGDNKPVIRGLFPTPTSTVPDTFAELGLMDAQFTAASVEKMHAKPAKTGGKRRAAAKPKDKAPETIDDADGSENDGVEDMPESGNAMG